MNFVFESQNNQFSESVLMYHVNNKHFVQKLIQIDLNLIKKCLNLNIMPFLRVPTLKIKATNLIILVFYIKSNDNEVICKVSCI